jgi:hypothetical protein
MIRLRGEVKANGFFLVWGTTVGPISDQPPTEDGVGLSFPAFGFRMPEQKGWTLLEPETPKPLPDLEQKRGGQPFPHSNWQGAGQKSWLAAPGCIISHSGPLADNFSQGTIPLPKCFPPAFVWAEAAGPLNGNAPIK